MRRAPETFELHYSRLMPRKPGILPLGNVEMVKQCRRCGAEFTTKSRAKKRCDPCASVVAARVQEKAAKRLKERRRVAKLRPGGKA